MFGFAQATLLYVLLSQPVDTLNLWAGLNEASSTPQQLPHWILQGAIPHWASRGVILPAHPPACPSVLMQQL